MTPNNCAIESSGSMREVGELGVSIVLPLSFDRLTGACIDVSSEEEAVEEEEEALLATA